jgi:hypothetical protein
MKEISSMDFPQYGEDFYFYGQTLQANTRKLIDNWIDDCRD